MSKRPEWARRAKIVMMEADITQNKLAEALGVSPQYITNALTGYQRHEKLAHRICEYLKIPFDHAV